MKKHLIYINLDGFGYYYYNFMKDKGNDIPNINRLIKMGVLFENAMTGIPSITCPMQTAIVSGCYSDRTGNCDKFWDRVNNKITVTNRLNRAQTVAEALREENHSMVSIQQFTLKGRGTDEKNPQFLYIEPGKSYLERFDILNKLISDLIIKKEDEQYSYNELPDAIFLYVDDLDSIGHNPPGLHAKTEEQRVKNVCNIIREIDIKIGEMINCLENKGILNSTYLLITSDHGMISYKGRSKLTELTQVLKRCGYRTKVCYDGSLKNKDFDILLTMHNIQCQVYFNKDLHPLLFSKEKLKVLSKTLLALPYVEKIMDQEELQRRGVCREYADMLISPIEGVSFSYNSPNKSYLYATHDSLNDKCQHIFTVATGPLLKENFIERNMVFNIDFLPTILHCLDWKIPKDSYGRIISTIIRDERINNKVGMN